MLTETDEPVVVTAIFGEGGKRIRPVRFVWQRRVIAVAEVTYTWITREGRVTVHHFAVTDGAGNVYEVRFDAESLRWSLGGVDGNF